MSTNPHRWKFFRAGGVDQVALRDMEDIRRLPELDPKLWVALAMPVRGTELDPRTLDFLDNDKDGRIRLPEILAAVKLVDAVFANPAEILSGGDGLSLAAIKDADVLEAAKIVIDALGKKDAGKVTLDDIEAYGKIVASLRVNGDGVLPPSATDDAEVKILIAEIMDTVGAVDDKSGEKGVNQAKVDEFFAQAQAYVDWYAQGEKDPGLLPLGPRTAAAAAALAAVRGKVTDYYTRCRLAAFDGRATAPLNGAEAELTALIGKELSPSTPEVARLPLARIEAGRALPLADGLNPAWSAPMATFASATVAPLLRASTALAEIEWNMVQDKLAAHEAWAASKPANSVEKLGVPRLRGVLASEAKGTLGKLIAEDAARDVLNKRVAEVERALLYKRDLFEVLNNFVNFSRFYNRKGAAFQTGTLYLDSRGCNLCFDVADAGKHGALAAMSSAYLAYCDLSRPSGEKRSIAAAFTDGDSDNIFVGRNGVFYDRKGRDWDATITKLVANPISVREAFWAPYKKLARLIEEQIAKRTQAADAKSHAMIASTAEKTANADKAAPPEVKTIDVGTVAAIGVAIGGIGAMITGILAAFFGLGAWMPIGIFAVILLVSGPSVVLAILKLRQRNLGPILDANGWAINGRARINVPFGGALTDVAKLPKNAERSLDDPYSDRKRPWKLYIIIAVVVVLAFAWFFGKIDGYLPGPLKSTHVLGSAAPAATPSTPPQALPAPAVPASQPAK